MSFPLSPANGQTATLNGIVYSYSTSTQAWTRVANSTLTYTAVNLSSTTASTGTNSGALIVGGGVGIGGSLYVGGTSTFFGNLLPSADSVYNLGSSSTQWRSLYVSTNTIYIGGTAVSVVNGNLQVGGAPLIASSTGTTSTFVVTNTSNSTSTTTGAIVVSGGIGVGGNINVGGNANISGSITATNHYVTSGSLIFSGNISSTAWTTSGIRHVSIPATITDTSSTGTVANAYTNAFGGNTIAASNTVTYTNYATMFVNSPVIGTNVTITNSYSIITAGSVNIGGTVTGGGIRTTSTSTAPLNPTVGDIWYNTTTDDIYRYTTDGVTSAWIDITGPGGLGISPSRNMIILTNSSTSALVSASSGYVNVLNYSGTTINIPIY
jgi:hypothetical protein